MKQTASGRYIVYGGMDHPVRGEAREVGILDTVTGDVRTVVLPTTCWHVVCHPVLDVFYAISFRVHPADRTDYEHWGMAWLRQYAFEIDAEHGQVLRHWVADRDVPAHVNSDVTISDTELIFCTGGSHTVVLVDLETMTRHRIVDEHPGSLESWAYPRQSLTTVGESLMRANVLSNANLFAESFRVSRGSLIDGIYACQLSADQTLLFTANRGQNHITVYDYPALTVRDRVVMPELGEVDGSLSDWADPRLGFHHSYLVSPDPPSGEH
jgi:hypothetical protein